MIELRNETLQFCFPKTHPRAKLSIDFQRTLRIPDDDGEYALPPGLGSFPLRHVDDFAENVPTGWMRHGGVMLPMFQSEAMWLNFSGGFVPERRTQYPFAVKVAAGKINAVTGESWFDGLESDPQDYMVTPKQPWLDGYCVEKGLIRQFVAMPLGSGYSAEEQITGLAEFGGLQVVVYPMKRKVFERRFPKIEFRPARRSMLGTKTASFESVDSVCSMDSMEMGLAPGGRMRQEIYEDPFDITDWDMSAGSRCFVHIANSLIWQGITGQLPPTVPPTAKQYTQASLPWFEYYDAEAKALHSTDALVNLKSVAQIAQQKGDVPLPENQSVDPHNVVQLRNGLKKDQVREGAF